MPYCRAYARRTVVATGASNSPPPLFPGNCTGPPSKVNPKPEIRMPPHPTQALFLPPSAPHATPKVPLTLFMDEGARGTLGNLESGSVNALGGGQGCARKPARHGFGTVSRKVGETKGTGIDGLSNQGWGVRAVDRHSVQKLDA